MMSMLLTGREIDESVDEGKKSEALRDLKAWRVSELIGLHSLSLSNAIPV